jgi:hypothetical protein
MQMKKIILYTVVLVKLSLSGFAQSVGIGTTAPDPSAGLEISSANKGFLPPRISINDLGNIINPARGLMVYVPEREAYYFWEGSQWRRITTENEVNWFYNGTSVYNNSNRIGIGTNQPNANALLDIKSTDKGVLFPRLTNIQRLAINNPPNGLHIFNTDIGSLEFFDSLSSSWQSYSNKIFDTVITTSVNGSQPFHTIKYDPRYSIYKITIESGAVTNLNIMAGLNSPTQPVKVFVYNYGKIVGQGGDGGDGLFTTTLPNYCALNNQFAGKSGGNAITVGGNVTLIVYNYGTVGGGGGGGGGGAASSLESSGGGGGGGGQTNTVSSSAFPGQKGRFYSDFSGSCQASTPVSSAQDGTGGSFAAVGIGGNGSPGTVTTMGQRGGNGGGWGQAGQNGSGSGGAGGAAGKAVANNGAGAHSNSIINFGAGIVYGLID